MRRSQLLAAVTLAAIPLGCGAEQGAQHLKAAAETAAPAASPADAALPPPPAEGIGSMPETPPSAGEVPPDVPRKIIYTADVELIVEKFDTAADQIVRLIDQSGGYIAESDLAGTPGSPRMGTWKTRVPVEKFESFVESVAALGELQRRHTDSQDVTEEFYDLEARIKNKKVEEQRLIEHLEETTGKLKDILDVEKELSRVREESERLQGRSRLLANLTSLTTVTIRVQERLGYLPVAAPTFSARIGNRFRASVDQLSRFGEWVVLALVSIVPWLPVWFVGAALAWLALRRFRRRWPAMSASGNSGTSP